MTVVHASSSPAPSVARLLAGLGLATLAVALVAAYLLVALRPSLLAGG